MSRGIGLEERSGDWSDDAAVKEMPHQSLHIVANSQSLGKHYTKIIKPPEEGPNHLLHEHRGVMHRHMSLHRAMTSSHQKASSPPSGSSQ